MVLILRMKDSQAENVKGGGGVIFETALIAVEICVRDLGEIWERSM